jgi:hypothetical protein
MTRRIDIQRIHLEGFSFGPHERRLFHDSLVASLARSLAAGSLGDAAKAGAERAAARPPDPQSTATIVAQAIRQRTSR